MHTSWKHLQQEASSAPVALVLGVNPLAEDYPPRGLWLWGARNDNVPRRAQGE